MNVTSHRHRGSSVARYLCITSNSVRCAVLRHRTRQVSAVWRVILSHDVTVTVSRFVQRDRERENFIRHWNRNKKHQTIQKFTCVAGCQKGPNTHRAGHLPARFFRDSFQFTAQKSTPRCMSIIISSSRGQFRGVARWTRGGRGGRGPCPSPNRRLSGFLTKNWLCWDVGPALFSKVTMFSLSEHSRKGRQLF